MGEIFSRMGLAQVYLSTFAELGTPYCDCPTIGNNCTMGGGGPTGECDTGCISWTDNNGKHWVGICSGGDTELE